MNSDYHWAVWQTDWKPTRQGNNLAAAVPLIGFSFLFMSICPRIDARCLWGCRMVSTRKREREAREVFPPPSPGPYSGQVMLWWFLMDEWTRPHLRQHFQLWAPPEEGRRRRNGEEAKKCQYLLIFQQPVKPPSVGCGETPKTKQEKPETKLTNGSIMGNCLKSVAEQNASW